MTPLSKAKFRHAKYYQELLKQLEANFQEKTAKDTALVFNEWVWNREQILRGQANSRSDEESDLWEICINYSNSIFIVTTYLRVGHK